MLKTSIIQDKLIAYYILYISCLQQKDTKGIQLVSASFQDLDATPLEIQHNWIELLRKIKTHLPKNLQEYLQERLDSMDITSNN